MGPRRPVRGRRTLRGPASSRALTTAGNLQETLQGSPAERTSVRGVLTDSRGWRDAKGAKCRVVAATLESWLRSPSLRKAKVSGLLSKPGLQVSPRIPQLKCGVHVNQTKSLIHDHV